MITDFLEKPINIKEISKDCTIDTFLVENNEKQIEQICDFLMEDKNHLMLVNGFKGTGKTSIVDFVSMYLNSDVLVLKYNFLETTILDDLLLGFFDNFRTYTLKEKLFHQELKQKIFLKKLIRILIQSVVLYVLF